MDRYKQKLIYPQSTRGVLPRGWTRNHRNSCIFSRKAYESSLEGTANTPGFLRGRKKLGSAIVFPPSSDTVLVGVILDIARNAQYRRRHHAPVGIIRLAYCFHQPFHAPVIRLLVFSRLQKEEDKLVDLQQRPFRALQRPRLSSPLPVDAWDADAACWGRCFIHFLGSECLEEERCGLASLQYECLAFRSAKQPPFASWGEMDTTKRAEFTRGHGRG
jgi:hypothetical protein